MDKNHKNRSQVVIEWTKYNKTLHIFLVYLIVSVVCGIVCNQLQEICYTLDSVINFIDPFLMITNNMYSHLCIVIGLLLINSRLSYMDDNLYAVLIRTGKKKWLHNKLSMLIINVILYLFIILIFTILYTSNVTYVGNCWSVLFRGAAMNLDYVINNNPPAVFSIELINRLSPYGAMLHAYFLMAAYCIVLSIIMFIINLRMRTNIGFIIALGIHFIGWIINYLDKTLFYLSPMNNSMLVSHSFGTDKLPSILYSYLFLFTLLLGLIVLSKKTIYKCDF